jgi:hypothetical protein
LNLILDPHIDVETIGVCRRHDSIEVRDRISDRGAM